MTRDALAVLSRIALAVAIFATQLSAPLAAERAENRFGSIYVDGRKAGTVHYTIEYGSKGEVETLRTRASLSILGVKLFNFEQNLREKWKGGALQQMSSRTEDDGRVYNAALALGADGYTGTVDDKPVELPDNAFPASVWHYAIIRQSLLFDLMRLRPMRVSVSRRDETVALGKRSVPAERFDFSGEWQATVWFDAGKQLLKFEYPVQGHTVRVQLD